jgi:serine/threonine protein kinase
LPREIRIIFDTSSKNIMERAARPAGQLIGHYRIDGRDASGIAGDIYRATDIDLPEYSVSAIALRIFQERVVQDVSGPDPIASFLAAGDLLNRLRHPCITRIYEHGVSGGVRYAVMAHTEGRSLHRVMLDPVNRGPSRLTAIVESVCRDIGTALDYLHRCGITHDAVNARNILVTPTNRCVLANVGYADERAMSNWAEALSPLARLQDAIAGTTSALRADGHADLRGLGVLLFEIAAGRTPDAGADIAATVDELNASGLAQRLSVIVGRLLSDTSDARIAHADDLLAEIGVPAGSDGVRGPIPAWNRAAAPTSVALGGAPQSGLAPPARHWQPESADAPTRRPQFRTPVVMVAAAIVIGFGGMAAYSLTASARRSRPTRAALDALTAGTPTATVLVPLSAEMPASDAQRATLALPATATHSPTSSASAPTVAPASATSAPATATAEPSPTPTQQLTATVTATRQPRPTARPRSTSSPATARPGIANGGAISTSVSSPTPNTASASSPTAAPTAAPEIINPPTATAPPIDE